MKRHMLLYISLLLISKGVLGKRLAPKEVLPVNYGEIYKIVPYYKHADNSQFAYLKVSDPKTNHVICYYKLYSIKYNPILETDVQDVFVSSLSIQGEFVIAYNEKQDKFKIPVDYLCKQ